MSYLPCHYLYMSFIFCTCWIPTISVLNLVIFPYYSNLLLRRRRWIGILWRGVLGYVLPRLPFLWCYEVFRCSILLRVILVFKDIIYVMIILITRDIWLSVDTFGRMCGTIDHGSYIRWVLNFSIKTRYDTRSTTSPRNRQQSSQGDNNLDMAGHSEMEGSRCNVIMKKTCICAIWNIINIIIPSILCVDNFFCRWIKNGCTSVIEWVNILSRHWTHFWRLLQNKRS
jgi:hypothetical protein